MRKEVSRWATATSYSTLKEKNRVCFSNAHTPFNSFFFSPSSIYIGFFCSGKGTNPSASSRSLLDAGDGTDWDESSPQSSTIPYALIGPHLKLKRLKQQIADWESSNAHERWKFQQTFFLVLFWFFCCAGVSYHIVDGPVSQGWGRAERDCWYFYFLKSRLAIGERKQPWDVEWP